MTLLKNSGHYMSCDRLDFIEFLADCPHSDNIAPDFASDLKIHRSCAEVPKRPCRDATPYRQYPGLFPFRRDSRDAGRGVSYKLARVSGISVGTRDSSPFLGEAAKCRSGTRCPTWEMPS